MFHTLDRKKMDYFSLLLGGVYIVVLLKFQFQGFRFVLLHLIEAAAYA